VQAVCAGFVYGLSVADSLIRSGLAYRAGDRRGDLLAHPGLEDRGTCVLFGDGAGAIVLRAEQGTGTPRGPRHPRQRTAFRRPPPRYTLCRRRSVLDRSTGFLRMEGKEVFKHAVVNMAAVVGEVLEKAGTQAKDIDWLVPHQANKRIIDGTGRKLGLPPERVVVTVDKHANTSAASIPLALDVAVKDGRIKRGDLLLLEGIGGGLSWGASLVRW
jgi:3-oxoacyl-[acyl-carrier-protein] synthase-3